MANIQPRKKCIAVIGAGAGGLATAKYLLAENCHVTFFERKAGPGGVWNTGPGSENFPMPVHEGLETNVPRNLMTFSDLRRPITTSLFPTSSDVNDHLHSYAEQLRAQYPSDDKLTFNFNTKRGQSAEVHTASYASVERLVFGGAVVAGGNYHQRFVPWEITPGLREWSMSLPATLLHSMHYRNANGFEDQTVLVVGNSASSWDISSQLIKVAKRVIVSSTRFRANVNAPQASPGSEAAPAIDRVDHITRTVTFVGGGIATNIDRIVFCTGYQYDFSFIVEGIRRREHRIFPRGLKVQNVYQHMFYTRDPSLAFVAPPKMSAAFTVAEAQSAVIARVLSSRLAIPCMPSRLAWENQHDDTWTYQMQEGLNTASGLHSFQLAQEKTYVNELLAWSLKAPVQKFILEQPPPPYWYECFEKAREGSRAVRDAFEAYGDSRHRITSLQTLGFPICRTLCKSGLTMEIRHRRTDMEDMDEQPRRCRSCFIFE